MKAGGVKSAIRASSGPTTGAFIAGALCSNINLWNRFIVSMSVADYTSQAWLQGFNEVGNVVFGITANELISFKVNTIWLSGVTGI